MSADLKFTPIKSSMMSGYHYDPASQALTVQFSGGKAYAYADVPQAKVDAMTAHNSAGTYFAASIKPHHGATPL